MRFIKLFLSTHLIFFQTTSTFPSYFIKSIEMLQKSHIRDANKKKGRITIYTLLSKNKYIKYLISKLKIQFHSIL